MNLILTIGSIIGLSSMILAAYLDHALTLQLSPHALKSMQTAIHYQQLYAVLIVAIGVALLTNMSQKVKHYLSLSAYIFIVGCLFFCGNIYFSVMKIPHWSYLTPIGGMLLMAGWLSLLIISLRRTR